MRYRLIAVIVLATSCSDGPAAFDVDTEFPSGGADGVRLTYNEHDDRVPAWTRGSDSVYYSAESYPPFPVTEGLLLAAPRTGGVVAPVVPLAPLLEPFVTAPAVAPDGNSIAFFEMQSFWRYTCGAIVFGDPNRPFLTEYLPVLQQASLRIRQLGSSAPDAAALNVTFGGRHLDTSRRPFGLPGVTVVEGHPFQRTHARTRAPLFRASWAPDNRRVVFSDGEKLLVWTVGTGSPVPIANTTDGVWPAWSPDGEWIAFTKLPRLRAERVEARCLYNGVVTEVFDITIYNFAIGELQVIRPDGTGSRALGSGDAPAWMPDNRQVVIDRAGQLWRVSIDGSSSVAIANTDQGQEPAVSPDGKWVAFSRLNTTLRTRDIWVAPL